MSRSLAPSLRPLLVWLGQGHDIFCSVWLFSKTSVMLGYPFPGPLTRGFGGGIFCLHHSHCQVAGFFCSKCGIYKNKGNPGNSAPFIPCIFRDLASLPPSLHLSGSLMFILYITSSVWVVFSGRNSENYIYSIFPKAKQLFSF